MASEYHPDAVRVTNEADVAKFTEVIAEAFADDAINRFILLGRESRPDHPKLSEPGVRVRYWAPLIKGRFEAGGILLHTYDWAGVALWLAPGVKKPAHSSADDTPVPEGAAEYKEKFERLKEKYLGDRHYWYLNLVGRSPGRTDKGAIRHLIEPFVKKGQEQGIPLWLEATNPRARDVYAHLGFKVVEEVRIGEGIINAEGWVQPGGEGVLLWAMAAGI